MNHGFRDVFISQLVSYLDATVAWTEYPIIGWFFQLIQALIFSGIEILTITT